MDSLHPGPRPQLRSIAPRPGWPLWTGAAGSGGSCGGNELRRTAVCRLQWALGVMGAVQVCRGQTWKGDPGPSRTAGPGSLTFTVFLPPQAGAGRPEGAGAGGVPLCTSQARPPQASSSSAVTVRGSLRRALVPTEVCARGFLSRTVVILCFRLLGSRLWGGPRLALRPRLFGRSKRRC